MKKNYKYILWAGRIISAIETTAAASAICFTICLFASNNGGVWNAENTAFRYFTNILALFALFGAIERLLLRKKIIETCHKIFGDAEIDKPYFDDSVSEEDINEYIVEANARYASANKWSRTK